MASVAECDPDVEFCSDPQLDLVTPLWYYFSGSFNLLMSLLGLQLLWFYHWQVPSAERQMNPYRQWSMMALALIGNYAVQLLVWSLNFVLDNNAGFLDKTYIVF
jgi:hypothetical protein